MPNETPATADKPAADPRPASSLLYDTPKADKPAAKPVQETQNQSEPEETAEADTTADGEDQAETAEQHVEGAAETQSEDGKAETTAAPQSIDGYEWGKSDWNEVRVPVKVDGQSTQVPIRDLVKSYQIGTAAEKRLAEANALKDKARAEVEAKANELTGSLTVAADLVKRAETLLDQDVSRIDWKALREDDPAEYAAKKAEIKDRREAIDKMKREAVAAYQQAVADGENQQKQRVAELLAQETERLLEKLPEWQNQDTAKAEKGKIVGYLRTQGFDEKDIMGAVDHRLVIMARKAMLYDEGQTKAAVAKKKVKLVPKVLKPGTTKADGAKKPRTAAEILYG